MDARPRSLSLIAPLTARRPNVCPASVDSKKPLQFEPARQPTTASTTLPPVPGFTATSLTNALPSTPPDCTQAVGSPTPAARTGAQAPLSVVAACRYSPRLVAARIKPLS